MRKRSETKTTKVEPVQAEKGTVPRGTVGTIHLAERLWQGSLRARCGKVSLGPDRRVPVAWDDPRLCTECLALHLAMSEPGRVSQPVYEDAAP